MSRPRVVVAGTAVLVLVVAAVTLGAGLTRERVPVEGRGTPPPFFEPTPVAVAAGQELCVENVLLGPDTDVTQFIVSQPKPVAIELEVRTTDATGGAPSAPSSYRGRPQGATPVRVELDATGPERQGRLCIRNTGRSTVTFVGTIESRTRSALTTLVEGQPAEPDIALRFLDDEPTTVLGMLPELLDRMTIFRGALGSTWLLWPLLVLVVVGVPAALSAVLLRALRTDDAAR